MRLHAGIGGVEGVRPGGRHLVGSLRLQRQLQSDHAAYGFEVLSAERADPALKPLLAGGGDLVCHRLAALAIEG